MRLFIYGTLKKGMGNDRLFPEGTIHTRARTAYGYYLYGGRGIPYLVEEDAGANRDDFGPGRVWGEVVEVDEPTLRRCDQLEGHPNWYERRPITLEDGLPAQAYFIPRDEVHGEPLPDEGEGAEWGTWYKD